MRALFSCIVVLLLSGCQTTRQTEPVTQAETGHTIVIPVNTTMDEAALRTGPVSSETSEQQIPQQATPQSQQDIWQRIAMQLELDIPEHKEVEYYRNWFINRPYHLTVVAKRAEPFLYLIVEKVEQRSLPLELALLPVVESSFDVFAYSHGRAAGLWQFISETGKIYGLEQNYWYDGRRDVAAATDAALSYLTYLNTRFNGNWNHAIAAYNSGSGRVSKAIRNNTKAGKPIDFFSLKLPKETSGYVPKLLALADIVANQEKYNVRIPPIANKPVLQLVDPQEQLDLAIAANYADMTVAELQGYNPGYNQWATAPQGPYHFLLPLDRVASFRQSVEENKGKGIKLVRYKVQSGDSLSVIAENHHTTSQLIRSFNDLSGDMIRTGQYLLIPTSTKNDKSDALSSKSRLAKAQSATKKGKVKVTHTVSDGDSLWTIAKDHKVSYLELAKWNNMRLKDTLKIGQQLVIWKSNRDGADYAFQNTPNQGKLIQNHSRAPGGNLPEPNKTL